MNVNSILIGALSLCLSVPAIAQNKTTTKTPKQKKEETVIIKKDGNNPQTVIEVKDGDVFVNGEKVASSNVSQGYKKIIIDNNSDMPETNVFEEENRFGDAPAVNRKAMLGVFTAQADENEKGATVQRVMPNSAAEKAGLEAGDRITKVNSENVTGPKALTEIISGHEAGDKVAITYERKGKTNTADVTLKKAAPEKFSRVYRYGPGDMGNNEDFSFPNPLRSFMFDVNDDPSAFRPKLGVLAEDRMDGEGVTINTVKPGTPAEKAGLQKDDILTRLDNEKIGSVDDLQDILRSVKPSEKIKVQYQRNGKTATAELSFPKPTRKKDL